MDSNQETNLSKTPLSRQRLLLTKKSKAAAAAEAEAEAEKIEEELKHAEKSNDECVHYGFKKTCRGKCTICLTCSACANAGQKLMCYFHLNYKKKP